jgi:protocatechuate 3,4-dioxygenase alpha subunit
MKPEAPTPSQTVGPFFGVGLPFAGGSQYANPEAHGSIRIEGQLLDGRGEPVAEGLIEMWEGDQFARCRTDLEGAFSFTLRKPDARLARGGLEAPHFEVFVFARGLLRHLWTRLYLPDEKERNAQDPVLALVEPERQATLIATRDGAAFHFDVKLQGADETVFFELPVEKEEIQGE